MPKALAIDSHPRPALSEMAAWLGRLQRKIKIKSRKYRRPRVISIAGVKLEIDRKRLVPEVVRALYRERYEDREAALVSEKITPGDRVLEIGAGIGFVTLLCAQRCGEDQVLAYEANPQNEALIRRNFVLNRLSPRLRIRGVAVKHGEHVLFVEPNHLSTGFINRGNGARRYIKCDAIGDVVREFQPNCLVMDVEGAEIELLPATPLQDISKIILETHSRIVGEPAIRDLHNHLTAQGFDRSEAFSHGKVWFYERAQRAKPAAST